MCEEKYSFLYGSHYKAVKLSRLLIEQQGIEVPLGTHPNDSDGRGMSLENPARWYEDCVDDKREQNRRMCAR